MVCLRNTSLDTLYKGDTNDNDYDDDDDDNTNIVKFVIILTFSKFISWLHIL